MTKACNWLRDLCKVQTHHLILKTVEIFRVIAERHRNTS